MIWMFSIITSLVPVCLDNVSLVIGHTRNSEPYAVFFLGRMVLYVCMVLLIERCVL